MRAPPPVQFDARYAEARGYAVGPPEGRYSIVPRGQEAEGDVIVLLSSDGVVGWKAYPAREKLVLVPWCAVVAREKKARCAALEIDRTGQHVLEGLTIAVPPRGD